MQVENLDLDGASTSGGERIVWASHVWESRGEGACRKKMRQGSQHVGPYLRMKTRMGEWAVRGNVHFSPDREHLNHGGKSLQSGRGTHIWSTRASSHPDNRPVSLYSR